MRRGTILLLGLLAVAVIGGFSCVSSYNRLVALDQGTQTAWAQVENVYQRRADLIPNLVETVRGAANFEKDTITAVTEARSRVGQVSPGPQVTSDPQQFQQFQQAQDQLSGALSRLLVVSEAYPELKATQNFSELQAQIEGSENRIAVERMRYNEAAQKFNTARNSFPTNVLAGLFGSKFQEKQFFRATAGSDVAPKVQF